MTNLYLINRLSEAAQYNIIAETGYIVDVNGHTKSLNGNDTRRYAGMCNRILNEVLMELANAGAEINNP